MSNARFYRGIAKPRASACFFVPAMTPHQERTLAQVQSRMLDHPVTILSGSAGSGVMVVFGHVIALARREAEWRNRVGFLHMYRAIELADGDGLQAVADGLAEQFAEHDLIGINVTQSGLDERTALELVAAEVTKHPAGSKQVLVKIMDSDDLPRNAAELLPGAALIPMPDPVLEDYQHVVGKNLGEGMTAEVDMALIIARFPDASLERLSEACAAWTLVAGHKPLTTERLGDLLSLRDQLDGTMEAMGQMAKRIMRASSPERDAKQDGYQKEKEARLAARATDEGLDVAPRPVGNSAPSNV